MSLRRFLPPLVLTVFPFHLLHRCPEPWGEKCDHNIPFRLEHLCTLFSCWSLLITFSCKEKLFWRGLRNVFIYAYSNILSAVVSLLCQFSRILVRKSVILSGVTLGILTTLQASPHDQEELASTNWTPCFVGLLLSLSWFGFVLFVCWIFFKRERTRSWVDKEGGTFLREVEGGEVWSKYIIWELKINKVKVK